MPQGGSAYVSPYAVNGGGVAPQPATPQQAYVPQNYGTQNYGPVLTGGSGYRATVMPQMTEVVIVSEERLDFFSGCSKGGAGAYKYRLSDGRSVVHCSGPARDPVRAINSAGIAGGCAWRSPGWRRRSQAVPRNRPSRCAARIFPA